MSSKLLLLLAVVLAAAGGPADAGDITAFVSQGRPSEAWQRGYGAALTTSFFQVVSFEGEAARMPAEQANSSMTSFTASALLSPPIGFVIPYGGVGIGLFRQSLGGDTHTGTLKALIVGVKLKLAGLAVLKAEYRSFALSGEPLIKADSRFSVGAGITF